MAGYTRQSAGEFTTGATINASDFENEFAALATAFGGSGHDHSGSGGNGPQLSLTTAVTGVLPLANGGTGGNLSDPGADRILFWDDSASATAFLAPDANFSISGTTLSLSEDLTTTDVIASGSAGIIIKNSGGSAVITAGGGGGTGVSFAGGVNITGQLTASGNFVFDSVTHTGTTGADVTLVSGTAGTSGNLAMWNADGDAVDSSVVAANVVVDADLGTAAALNAGTGANEVVQLDGSARLPAVDGSQLTNLGLSTIIPAGCILLWSGSVASIPSGWALCDGTNSTPDLRNRFVVGAGDTYAVDATGGADTVSLSSSEIPSHTHTFSATTNSAGSHSHSGSTTSAGSHNHNPTASSAQGFLYTNGGASNQVASLTAGGGAFSDGVATTSVTNTGGLHSHSLSVSSAGSHSHSVSGTTGASGSGSAHENRPPYYALCYIMKT